MLRDDFFTDPNGGYPSYASKPSFQRAWKKVEAFEKSCGRCIDDGFDRDSYLALFNSMTLRQFIDFSHIKSALMYYINYGVAHGLISDASLQALREIRFENLTLCSDSDAILYYKDFAQLQDSIDKTIKDSGRHDNSAHDVAVSALYMAWFGLPVREALAVKKSDVSENGLSVGNKLLQVPDYVLKVWLRLRDAEGFFQQARNIIPRKYVESVYLLRTEKNDKLTVHQLHAILNRFNSIGDSRRSLSYDVVYRSGIYNRAYELECESFEFPVNNPEFAAKIFETDINSMTDSVKRHRKIKDYEYYKQLFR